MGLFSKKQSSKDNSFFGWGTVIAGLKCFVYAAADEFNNSTNNFSNYTTGNSFPNTTSPSPTSIFNPPKDNHYYAELAVLVVMGMAVCCAGVCTYLRRNDDARLAGAMAVGAYRAI